MAEIKRLEVWKPHLGSYRNVGDGYENQQFFRTSLGSLVATDMSRKAGISEAQGREGSGCQVWLKQAESTILLGGLCGCVSRESQTRDSKQNLQGIDPAEGKLMRIFRTTSTGELLDMS